MIDRVSRKNRRKDPPTIRTILPIILLALSSIVLLGGIGNLAWALNGQKAPIENQRNALEADQDASEKDPYNGRILASNEPSSASSSSTSTAATSTTEAPTEPEPSRSDAAAYDQDGKPQTQAPNETRSTTSSSSVSESASQQSYTIYHEASEEVPVYRTVHHQASTPREIKIGGYTRIEWTKCPVCSQVHEGAFNERVVDHVSQSTCSACGGIHYEGYEEVVYY